MFNVEHIFLFTGSYGQPRNTLENTNIFEILQFSTIIGDQKEFRSCVLLK